MKSGSLLEVNKSHSSVILLTPKTHRSSFGKRDESVVVTIQKYDRHVIAGITFFIIIQCVAVLVLASTVITCKWSPDLFNHQTIKVVMVMYLYDYEKCGYAFINTSKGIRNINLIERFDTRGSNLKPIPLSPLVKSTSIRLTQSVQLHMEISLGFHCVWMFIAISALLFCHLSVNFKYLKIVISIFMYTCILMVIFDVSMAIVYLAHIQQSLTISMVLRHAGWAVGMKVDDPQEFAGWIPMLASVMWLRCIVFLTGNILFIRRIWHIRKKIKKKEVQKKHNKKNTPIPEPLSGIREDPTKNTFVVHA